MADRKKRLGRSVSTESTEHSITMGKSVLKEKKQKKPKERWLLTRKTWRYMADAGRKLIPEGVHNRPEDVPKIEAYFQEVCKREPRFLLWRKNSYPGALVRKNLKSSRRKSSACRKAVSVNDVENLKAESVKHPTPTLSNTRLKIQQMKADFLNEVPSYSRQTSEIEQDNPEEKQLITMLEQYLKIAEEKPSTTKVASPGFNYEEFINKLQQHLASVNYPSSHQTPQSAHHLPHQHVQFEGDHVQKSLCETLSRYFSHSPNRNKVVSDLLTDRKTLEKLYFELRKTKGFRGSRGGTGYVPDYNRSSYNNQVSDHHSYRNDGSRLRPPPLIEVEGHIVETTYSQRGTQTLSIPDEVLCKIEEEYKKALAEEREEQRRDVKGYPRRRSSVDNDDVSQSVSDTIKRYLRMARKKSVDSGKGDKFKRVNYDRNLRNIKAKGEITKPGDDDGLNKGCQTNDDWILTYRSLKFLECYDISDAESRISSARSSFDAGADELQTPIHSPPPTKSSSHSFLSNLLHGKHDNKHDKSDKSNSTAAASTAAMQKSKSSSNVIQQGGRLVAKTIFRSRSKSQQRPSQATCSWTPQGDCLWTNVAGKQIILSDTALLQLTEIERKILQKVAVAKLQALNLGVSVKIPAENVGGVVSKPKKRQYLLKKKSVTTSLVHAARKESEKGETGGVSGLVFGIPLTQCIENDKLTRAASGTNNFRSHHGDFSGSADECSPIARHGSRSSFNSLIDTPRGDESGSCESLLSRDRMVGSVPGLLDALSCGSTPDIRESIANEECFIPNILSKCFRHIEQNGLHTLGIFRVSTSKKRIRELREGFDCGKETNLDDSQCPHDVATLIKEYLRELPDPLLCRDLYNAFIQTQRIRNRRLQFEALQHLIQLLPPTNRDTLYALLTFLEIVARNSNDTTTTSGELLAGNKMDSNNLATVFAPNILHCSKPGSTKDTSAERSEDRIDVINVVRTLLDHYKQLFIVSAELLHEVYVYMMDSHPEALDLLLSRKETVQTADESVDEVDSESYSATWSSPAQVPDTSQDNGQKTEARRTWSREEFLHEAAATGGPDMGMRIRHKDRIRERARRKRDVSLSRKRKEEETPGTSISTNISLISRIAGKSDDEHGYSKNRSSSLESSSSAITEPDINKMSRIIHDDPERRRSSPYVLDKSGVLTASLTIPVHTTNQGLSLSVDDDIPYIEDADNSRQQFTIGVVKSPSAPPRRRQRSISGSDSSAGSSGAHPIAASISLVQDCDSAVGSSAYSSFVQNTPTSVSSSVAGNSTPPSWASTPPTSPDSSNLSTNYALEEPASTSRVPVKKNVSVKEPSLLQKLSFISNQDTQHVKNIKDSSIMSRRESARQQKHGQPNISKSSSASAFGNNYHPQKDPTFTPSISSIGNAVLRSRTADFERMTKAEEQKPKQSTSSDKKKYTKRRYTDSRHQTKPLPDLEALNNNNNNNNSHSRQEEGQQQGGPQVTPVYKRKELISSVHSKQS